MLTKGGVYYGNFNTCSYTCVRERDKRGIRIEGNDAAAESAEDVRLLGYFTLALKPLTVRGQTVSNTTKRKLLRIGELDESSDTYTMSAYLIAQIGKNFSESGGKEITGAELLKLAWDKVKEIQYLGGGIVTFLEAENEEKLLSFYRDNRFSRFGRCRYFLFI